MGDGGFGLVAGVRRRAGSELCAGRVYQIDLLERRCSDWLVDKDEQGSPFCATEVATGDGSGRFGLVAGALRRAGSERLDDEVAK